MHRPVLAIAILQLAACDPTIIADEAPCSYVTDTDIDQGIDQVRQRYGDIFGWRVPGCEAEEPLEVNLLSDDSEFPDFCPRPDPDVGHVIGCSSRDINGDYHIWVLECLGDPVGTIAHEHLHNTLRCDLGDADAAHAGDAWDWVAPR